MSKITFADKSYLNENADIPEVNKVTDNNINEIKSVVNTNDDTVLEIIASNVYSTSEVKTNNVWVDNKPIYRKVLTGTTTTKDAFLKIAHGISNYEYIMIDNKSFVKSVGASTYIIPINCPPNTSANYNNRPVRAIIENNDVSLYIGSYNGYTSFEYAIILEYTKAS